MQTKSKIGIGTIAVVGALMSAAVMVEDTTPPGVNPILDAARTIPFDLPPGYTIEIPDDTQFNSVGGGFYVFHANFMKNGELAGIVSVQFELSMPSNYLFEMDE